MDTSTQDWLGVNTNRDVDEGGILLISVSQSSKRFHKHKRNSCYTVNGSGGNHPYQ